MTSPALGVLDQSPIFADGSPAASVRATIDLARRAEALGYTRYWLAEHHAMGGLADASPEVLLARLTAETQHIRLGTGGIMLPHYSAFKVAEVFRMLEALAPGRIDLGIGRAPGGSGLVSAALESRDVTRFEEQLSDLRDHLAHALPPSHPFARLVAQPAGAQSPPIWMLGSSDYGATLAADRGLPFAFAQFIGGDAPEIVRAYRRRFTPTTPGDRPRVIVATGAIVAESAEEAEALTWPLALWRLRLFRGRSGPMPSLEEARAYAWSGREREEVLATRNVLAGTPAQVRDGLLALAQRYEADELMVVTIVPDAALRVRSYELLAEAFALPVAA